MRKSSRVVPGFGAIALIIGLVGCDTQSPSEPVGPEPQLSSIPSGLTPQEQAMVDAVMAGTPGAVLDRNVGCAFLTGFFDDGVFAGFGLLSPQPGPTGICPFSNFIRTNPDGTVDFHTQGSGTFFLIVNDPFTVFGSLGSDVIWRAISHQNGTSVFNVSGTLSDGSRVRAQFVTDPNGDNKAANTLWVEGLGYVVGGPPGQR